MGSCGHCGPLGSTNKLLHMHICSYTHIYTYMYMHTWVASTGIVKRNQKVSVPPCVLDLHMPIPTCTCTPGLRFDRNREPKSKSFCTFFFILAIHMSSILLTHTNAQIPMNIQGCADFLLLFRFILYMLYICHPFCLHTQMLGYR